VLGLAFTMTKVSPGLPKRALLGVRHRGLPHVLRCGGRRPLHVAGDDRGDDLLVRDRGEVGPVRDVRPADDREPVPDPFAGVLQEDVKKPVAKDR
jgi:hypothetical protein